MIIYLNKIARAGNNQAVLLIMDSRYVIVVGGAMLPGYVFVLFLQPRMK